MSHTTDPRDEADARGNAGEHLPAIVDTAMPMILRAEIDSQIATARQYPRNIHKAISNITGLATLDEETAAESLYALVRKKKQQGRNPAAQNDQENKAIEGPSIRLAEIAAQCWGNCRIEAHVVTVNRQEKYVEAVGTFHDLETNMASTATVRRNISTSSGYLFSADMITVTGNAACAIAKRNAILAGIPRGVYRPAYQAARGIVAGTHATLSENREKAIKAFAAFGVTPAQIFEALDLEGEGDIKLDHIATLRAMFMSIKNGEATVEEMFAKEKPAQDPDRNPLVKSGGADQQQQGGSNEVASDKTGGDQASSTANRSDGAGQQDRQAGEKPATDSAAAETAAHPSGHEAGHQPAAGSDSAATAASNNASATPAPADAGTSDKSGAAASSSQPDLLSGATRQDSDGRSGGDASTGGAGEVSRGTESKPAPSPADRLRSYSKHLLSIENGGPPKLGKASEAWMTKHGRFEGDAEKKRGLVYAAHADRLAGSLDVDKCKAKVEGIVG